MSDRRKLDPGDPGIDKYGLDRTGRFQLSLNVLGQQICFDVDLVTNLSLAQSCNRKRVRNNRNAKTVGLNINQS